MAQAVHAASQFRRAPRGSHSELRGDAKQAEHVRAAAKPARAVLRPRHQPGTLTDVKCLLMHLRARLQARCCAQAGFKTLLQDGNVLKCWSERLDAIYHAELGASAAILRAGFNLDCLLQRCGARVAPHLLQACTLAAKS